MTPMNLVPNPKAKPNTFAYLRTGGGGIKVINVVANNGYRARVEDINGWAVGREYGIASERILDRAEWVS